MGHRRVEDGEFYDIVDEFVKAAQAKWPHVLIQWEDFTNDKAFPLLERYRNEVLCFNDDIQGTGAVALAGLLAAMRHLDRKLSEQKIVFFGAGSASVGIADMICAGMTDEGLPSMEEARQRVWLVDSRGLVTHRREGELQSHKIPYATDDEPAVSLLDVVERIKPTIIIGASGQPQTFTREVLSAMYRSCDRPIVFALSNPTSKSECTASQAYHWTNGDAIFASGSPFPSVRLNNDLFVPGQFVGPRQRRAKLLHGADILAVGTQAQGERDLFFI